jgi:hypothetical protein
LSDQAIGGFFLAAISEQAQEIQDTREAIIPTR